MAVGFGGSSVFNRASPSSYPRCVAAILRDYATVPRPPARILDVGGTERGFRSKAPGVTVVIANPQKGVGADVDYVSNIGPDVEGFDLAMLFGLIMYLKPEEVAGLLRDVKQRLRGPATVMIAEPDPETGWGWAEIQAKKIVAALGAFPPDRFNFHTKGQATELLRQAGFNRVRERADLIPTFRDSAPLPAPRPAYYVLAAQV
ncbi:hypothetical protein [Roseococcus sp. YIM B11640]|uniref:hypothetical protein n=1 Tax=Roseococcus sp. YIM B11640 TaxID=3133973 RepID=UPI003C7E49BF